MTTLDKDRILEHRGKDLCDRGGEKLGSIEEIYLDAETDQPAWALVNTGLFGTRQTFVPLREAAESDGTLTVPVDKATVKDAPKVEHTGQLTKREEAGLHAHYGLDYSAEQAPPAQ